MIDIYSGEGSFHAIGEGHGHQLAAAVRHNVTQFTDRMARRGLRRDDLRRRAIRAQDLLEHHRLDEIAGIAEGAKVAYPDILAYNLFNAEISPDECTVMWAMSDSAAAGRTLFLKNSDKIGGKDMVGDGFYQHKEINVILAVRPQGKPAVVGVASAGSTGVKMGVNDRGVATGTNIARTTELRLRKVNTSEERALDRVQLSRDGLEFDTAQRAGLSVVEKLSRAPMATPGNLEFVDPTLAYIIEGSYDRLAVQLLTAGVGARTNRFVVLDALNDPEDISSYARYVRSNQLLGTKGKTLTPQDFIAFSQDHVNGPGPNSICRHGVHFSEETSQSAQVVEIDSADPTRTMVWIALGKPCWAWRHGDGNLRLTMRFRPEDIPEGFRSGEVWKRYWTEQPYAEPAAASRAG
jgi:hypothetical protein